MTNLRTDFFPDEPSTEDWEPMIREALQDADQPRHVTITHPAITLRLDQCVYADGTPVWDHPLVGASGTVTATRADGQETTISLEDGHGWEEIADLLDEVMDGWAEKVMQALSELADTEQQVVRMEADLRRLKSERAEQARYAARLGVTQYRIAEVVGRSQTSVSGWLGKRR